MIKELRDRNELECKYKYTRSLGGLLDFVLRALRALRPCDPRNDVSNSEKSK